MPRTHRDLRRCYFLRQYVSGDSHYAQSSQPVMYDISPREPEIIPIVPVSRVRRDSVASEPPRSSRRIRWNESADTVREFSPDRITPEVEEVKPWQRPKDPVQTRYEPSQPPVPVSPSVPQVHKSKKKPKPKTTPSPPDKMPERNYYSDEDVNMMKTKKKNKKKDDSEKRRKEMESEIRKRKELDKQRHERALMEQRLLEEERGKRLAAERELQAQSVRPKTQKKKFVPVRRTQSQSRIYPKPPALKPVIPRTKSETNLLQMPSGKTKSVQKPKWNYVGDPTKRAYHDAKWRNEFPSDFEILSRRSQK